MKVKKILPVALAAVMAAGLAAGCSGGDKKGGTEMTNQTVYDAPYTLGKSDAGKGVLYDRSQTPQIMLSTLIRTDLLKNADFMDSSEIEDYFAIAAATDMNTVDIVVMWSQVEPEKDSYVFTDVKNYLDFAKKYDLKVNIEWYGSLVDGESHSANIPDYVYNDTATYPVLKDVLDYAYFGRLRFMDWSNKNLIERESKAIYELMNYVYDWNQENNKYDPVITVQIGQGADRFQRWRTEAYGVYKLNGESFTQDEAWDMVNTYLDGVAKGVKYSKYKALTRVEFCEQNNVVNYVSGVEALDNIDIVCPTYLHEISNTKNGIRSFGQEFPDSVVLNVENWASDINYRQILATFAMGGTGYVSYMLANPIYTPESPNGALYNRYNPDGATLAEKFTEKNTRATDTKKVVNALERMFVAVANAPRANITALGMNNLINSNTGAQRVQKIYLSNGLLLEYSNPQDSLGLAVYDSNYLYVWGTHAATLDITNCTITVGQKGVFAADGSWTNEGAVTLANNSKLTMEADTIYRIRINSISALPDQSELKSGGYASAVDSIRG